MGNLTEINHSIAFFMQDNNGRMYTVGLLLEKNVEKKLKKNLKKDKVSDYNLETGVGDIPNVKSRVLDLTQKNT